MSVSLLDLSLQNEPLRDDITKAFNKVYDSQHFILGPDVKEFETDLARYAGAKYALGVSSGTDALLMALMALKVLPGDEIITTPYSFFATAGSIARLGCVPVFVDIDPVTFNIDPDKIESAITEKTKAIMPVHLFGQSADMTKIKTVANKYSLPVIEDAAQAIGSSHNSVRVGSLGDMACFSFFPSKNLGCFGDGGAVTTNSEELYSLLLSIRNHGQFLDQKYLHESVGGNFRIDTLQAAILKVKLPHLDGWLEGRRNNANKYGTLLRDMLPESAFANGHIVFPEEVKPSRHTYNQFVLRLSFRDYFLDAARSNGIGVMVYYPYPLHLQPCFLHFGHKKGDFPESEKASFQTVALPVYSELPHEDLEKVVSLIIKSGKDVGVW
jgi:dTDP-4-amino-4,6-dideoxygalactose transaminase